MNIEVDRAADNLLRTGKGQGPAPGRRESAASMQGGAFAQQHPGYGAYDQEHVDDDVS
jgi:hypothetical protein